MRALSAMVLGSALLLQPATAGAQGGRETIVAQFDEAVKLYESRGYRPDPGAVPTGAVIGLLAADSRAYIEVQLERGVEYLIEGFCDEDCDDLDLALISADGDEVVRDGGRRRRARAGLRRTGFRAVLPRREHDHLLDRSLLLRLPHPAQVAGARNRNAPEP